jgi:hypothetical protein
MSAKQFLYRAAVNCPHSIDAEAVNLSHDHRFPGNALGQLADRLEAAEAALCDVASAANLYYTRYVQDEADEDGPANTGCTVQQSQDARALRDALKVVFN